MTIGIILLENQVDRKLSIDVLKEWGAINKIAMDFRTAPIGGDGREAAAKLLGHIAPHVLHRSPGRVVVLTNSWRNHEQAAALGRPRVRMLERAALAHGVMPVLHQMDTAHLTRILDDGMKYQPVAPETAPGSGAWLPHRSILMVADRPNSAAIGSLKYRLPLVSLHGGGCSTWVAEHLEQWGVPESSLYWINSEDCFGMKTDAAFAKVLRPRATFALGAVAAKWCAINDIPATEVLHPRYVTQARNRTACRKVIDTYPLGKMIEEKLKEELWIVKS